MRRMRRWLFALILGGACAAVLHTSVYTDFERVRFRVVASPQTPTAGAVVIPLPDLTRLAGQPVALVLRLANAGETARQVRIAAGGEVLRRALVPADGDIRVDLGVSDGVGLADPGKRVELAAPPPGDWSLNYLEVANVHGFSTGLFEFQITPAEATPQGLGGVASVPVLGLLVALYGLRWRRIAHRRGRVVHAVAATLVASFLAVGFAAPFVSGFAIHLAPHTFLVCVAVLYYPALAAVARGFRPRLQLALEAAGVQIGRAGRRAARWTWAAMVYGTAATLAAGVSLGRPVMRGAAAAWAGRHYVKRAARWAWGAWRALLAGGARVHPAVRCRLRSLGRAFEHATHIRVSSALQIFAVTALAVAQPLYDVVSREPAFFVARNTTTVQLGAFVVLVGVVLPLVFIGIEAVAARLHRVAGGVCHVLLLTVLGGALLLPPLKRLDAMDTVPLLAVALLLAGSIATACQRSIVGRMFLTALSPAALVIPAAFLLHPDVRGAVIIERNLIPAAARVQHTPTIVFIVFDEFPTNSLMNREREIDETRFPHFARLAGDATWYRNASTVSSQTLWAVPAMVTGKYPVEPHAVPTRRYYPNNLFTLLSQSYRMTVFGRFLQLCPAGACLYDLEVHDTLWDLTADLAVVYSHVVAPDSLAARLPSIVGDWQGFATRRMFREVAGERATNDRRSEYDRFLSTITSEPGGRLYFLHTLTPHMPFEYVPSGRRYVAPDYQGRREGGAGLFLESDPWLPLILQQRHLLQAGFADRFIGNLLDRLQALDIYDESLVVVTADHGSSFRHGQSRRNRSDGNLADILLVPSS